VRSVVVGGTCDGSAGPPERHDVAIDRRRDVLEQASELGVPARPETQAPSDPVELCVAGLADHLDPAPPPL
jgi:hypothetical protein